MPLIGDIHDTRPYRLVQDPLLRPGEEVRRWRFVINDALERARLDTQRLMREAAVRNAPPHPPGTALRPEEV
jgi:hypothetical protein